MRRALSILGLVTLTGCSPAQRMAVGGGVAAVGAGAAAVAVMSMVGECQEDDGFHERCKPDADPAPANAALPVVAGGLGVAFLGGLIMATSVESSAPAKRATSAPPPRPESYPLGMTEAVGMAVARLVLSGLDGKAKRMSVLEVDSAQCSFGVEAQRAKLSNLRVRTGPGEQWCTVAARYWFETEWRVTSLAATSACAP